MAKIWHKYIKSDLVTGVWKIEESEEELQRIWQKNAPFFSVPKRRMEWLASRILLRELLQMEGFPFDCESDPDPSGRPRLTIPGMYVSISHSGSYAAVAVGREPMGVDIERMDRNILKLCPKFMNEADFRNLAHPEDTRWMFTVWSAKESMFKQDNREGIDFKAHLFLHPGPPGFLRGEIRKDGTIRVLSVPYQYFDDYVITWAIDNFPVQE